jgi:hypothetical protein
VNTLIALSTSVRWTRTTLRTMCCITRKGPLFGTHMLQRVFTMNVGSKLVERRSKTGTPLPAGTLAPFALLVAAWQGELASGLFLGSGLCATHRNYYQWKARLDGHTSTSRPLPRRGQPLPHPPGRPRPLRLRRPLRLGVGRQRCLGKIRSATQYRSTVQAARHRLGRG